ncbi:hypothetical protein [Neorhizobium sp. NCHU2750]|uniref:phage terminase large subunit family protein n=1 Tax=Neorhizobium sp. NCHU2750 TaxID=1825976 RepID=UPI000E7312F7|nr:hypothetical protein NCHU2750_23470 [Neorhizobium sp. NCHU2750]
MSDNTPYNPAHIAELLALYHANIPVFAKQVFNIDLSPKQVEICEAFQHNRQISVKGSAGFGKTLCCAVLVWWSLCTHDQLQTAIFGPSEATLKSTIWKELQTLHTRMAEPFRGFYEVSATRISRKVNPSTCFAEYRLASAENISAARGIHSPNVYIFADEASGIPDVVFTDALLNILIADPNPKLCLISNPSHASGFFWRTWCDPEISDQWTHVHGKMTDAPGFDPANLKAIAANYGGPTTRNYRVYVEGEFPLSDESGLIPREHVEYAVQNECFPPENAPIIWGLDPAGQGADSSVLCIRQDNKVLEFKQWNDLNPTQLAYAIKDLYERTPKNQRPVVISIDANGLGYGVYSAVKDLGLPAYECKFAGTPTRHPERYSRVRDQLYAEMADWFAGENVQIPNNAKLIEELCSVQFEDASGKIKIEKKDQIKKRIGRSPDFSDALGLTFAVSRTRYASKYNWNTKIVYDHLQTLE